MKNQKFEYLSVRKFLVPEGEALSNICKRMVIVYGNHAPSCTTVFEWIHHFKDGQLNIEDNPRCGRLITTTDNETVKDVQSLIIEDRRITIQQVAYVLGVSTYTVHGIIHDQLLMVKVSLR